LARGKNWRVKVKGILERTMVNVTAKRTNSIKFPLNPPDPRSKPRPGWSSSPRCLRYSVALFFRPEAHTKKLKEAHTKKLKEADTKNFKEAHTRKLREADTKKLKEA
jgi:hypothetical protein